MKVVFMGSPEFALPSLQSLMSNQYDITAVYTQPDKPAGRGRQMVACPVKEFAVSRNMRVVQPETFRDTQQVGLLAGLQPDIIVVAAYGKILPQAVLDIPRYRCVNVHPSLLPRYRGPSPVAAAILNGDPVTGVSIMLVERKVDSGPVLSRREMAVEEQDTTGSLTTKLAAMGAALLVETLPAWVEGRITPAVQDDALATHTTMETKEDGRLDWHKPAVRLWRQVRAYQPWPGSFFAWKGEDIRVLSAVPLASPAGEAPGRVVALPRGGPARVAVATADGLLGLVELHPQGKRAMPAVDFMAGHRGFAGSQL
jgi:methionyl-tRNA formyltransferase